MFLHSLLTEAVTTCHCHRAAGELGSPKTSQNQTISINNSNSSLHTVGLLGRNNYSNFNGFSAAKLYTYKNMGFTKIKHFKEYLVGKLGCPSQRQSVLNIHWKDWCWSWNSSTWRPDAKNWLIWKDPDAGKDWRREEKGTTEDVVVAWHHRLNGHEFE